MNVSISKARLNVNLTKEQNDCIESKSKDLLIKGGAGSGKTLVLLKKAIKIKNEAVRNNQNIKIAFFTYAKTLTKYSEELIDEIENDDKYKDMLTISTFHSYTSKLVMAVNGRFSKNIDVGKTNQENKKKILEDCLESQSKIYTNHRLYKLEKEFWIDEISWIKGKRIKSKEEYINGDRTGRGSGVRLSKKDKEIVYSFYEEYNNRLKRGGYIEYNDMSNIVLDKFNLLSEKYKFDYVLVDEAQDLSYSQLLLLKKIATQGIIIAADHAQKIYKNSFTWSELGINVRGNASKSLVKNFRSTREIMELSYDLLKNNKSHKGKDTEFTNHVIPDINGNRPVIFKCENSSVEENTLIKLLNNLNDDETTIGIPFRSWKERNKLVNILKKQGIDFEHIKDKDEWTLLEPGVKLVTMHSAKGLEFDVVIIPMVDQGIIPKAIDCEEDKEAFLESERSLLYVAMTRAKDELYILTSNPSQFIDEMDKNLYDLIEQ